jgi:hypothetical protein
MNWIRESLPCHADGAVVAPPSIGQRIYDFLFGRKALQQAAAQSPPPMPQQDDISAVRLAAEDAGRRMQAAKQQMPPQPDRVRQ